MQQIHRLLGMVRPIKYCFDTLTGIKVKRESVTIVWIVEARGTEKTQFVCVYQSKTSTEKEFISSQEYIGYLYILLS
jgi:hypothetical protein